MNLIKLVQFYIGVIVFPFWSESRFRRAISKPEETPFMKGFGFAYSLYIFSVAEFMLMMRSKPQGILIKITFKYFPWYLALQS